MSPTRMSKLESAMRLVLEFNEAFNRHDVAGMMQLMSDGCVFENNAPDPDGSVYLGKEVETQFQPDIFPDAKHWRIPDEIDTCLCKHFPYDRSHPEHSHYPSRYPLPAFCRSPTPIR